MLSDLSDADHSLQIHALLLELDKLDGPSSQAERRRILDTLGLNSDHCAFLARRGALAPSQEKSRRNPGMRVLTELGRQWLANPALIPQAPAGKARSASIRDVLRRFSRDQGLPVDKSGYILASRQLWEQNLWRPLRGRLLAPRQQDLHLWVHHLQSSQAFALNLFGPLQLRLDWALAAWAEEFPAIQDVVFEYPHDGDPLAETADGQPHRTRVDVRVDFAGERTALIEVKFTEPTFGPCNAGHSREDIHQKAACRQGGLTLPALESACFLMAQRKRRYFSLLLAPGSIASSAGLASYGQAGCPLSDGLYQISRNLLMVDQVRRKEGRRAEFVVVAPGRLLNRPLHSCRTLHGHSDMLAFLQSVVRPEEKDCVRFIEFDSVVARAAVMGGEAQGWADYMEKKYVAALS